MLNALHRYTQQAVCIFDYPLSFDWARRSESVSNVLECFSEYGSSRQSTKYQGRAVTIRCHCVVFSNVLPIQEVRHRDVVLITVSGAGDSQASTLVMGPRFMPGGLVNPSADAGVDRSRSRSR